MPVIRTLTSADAAALADFFAACAADEETTRFFHPHPLTEEFARDLCGRVATIKDRYYVAVDAGRIQGYAMMRGADEGYAIPSFGACVHPNHRGIGLGRQLLERCLDDFADAPAVRLTVDKVNARAIHLYRTFGFELTEKDERNLIGVLTRPIGGSSPRCATQVLAEKPRSGFTTKPRVASGASAPWE